MNFLEVVAIAVGLAMDALAVAISCSIILKSVSPRQVFRIAFHFGLFQALMPVLGWLAGSQAQSFIEAWDHWVAFSLLSIIGVRAIVESYKEDEAEDSPDEASAESPAPSSDTSRCPHDPTRGMSLVVYSVATSIDAMAVGVSLGAIKVDIVEPAVIIGVVTSIISCCGILFGRHLGEALGTKVEKLGGVILIAIGFKILLSHTVFQ